jgi:hypothetical protein
MIFFVRKEAIVVGEFCCFVCVNGVPRVDDDGDDDDDDVVVKV